MNPYDPADGTCVSFEEMLIESVIIVVKCLPQFFLRNNTLGLHFSLPCLGGNKIGFSS